VQTVPQAPQFFGSLLVSMQRLPQSSVVAAQSGTQVPALHTSVALQRLLQPPQCAASISVFTQVPPHEV
jgi:hypothetical protein